MTAIPVNRVVEVYARMGIDRVESEQQAAQVCGYLGCDALIVASITLYDPFYPPKVGAAMQLFRGSGTTALAKEIDPHELARPGRPLAKRARFRRAERLCRLWGCLMPPTGPPWRPSSDMPPAGMIPSGHFGHANIWSIWIDMADLFTTASWLIC